MKSGRKPSMNYQSARNGYYCYYQGERVGLAKGAEDAPNGQNYFAALEKFRKLLAQDEGKGTDDYQVAALLNQYRAHLKSTRKSGVPGVFKIMARGFAEEFGKLRVKELKPYDGGRMARPAGSVEQQREGACHYADPRRRVVGERLVFRCNTQKGFLWMNGKKTQRDRVILLTSWAQEYVEKLIEKRYGHPNIKRLHEQFSAYAQRNPVAVPWTVPANNATTQPVG